MQEGIAMRTDGITYFSLITHEPQRLQPREDGPQEGVRLTFRSSADFWGESLSFGLGPQTRPHIETGGGGRFSSLAVLGDEQTLLWVGKILRRREGEDEVFLRIYGQADVLDYAEPSIWHVASRGLHQEAAFDLVILSGTGQSPRIVDELRLGPTWRSVVPVQDRRPVFQQ
jgi:hypothetical protein